MTELFRFILHRPAEAGPPALTIGAQFDGSSFNKLSHAVKKSWSEGSEVKLRYGAQIATLDSLLPADLPSAKLVVSTVTSVFRSQELEKLIASEAWANDENSLELALLSRYVRGRDRDGNGPRFSRYRQLYDIVRHVAAGPKASGVLVRKKLVVPVTKSEEQEAQRNLNPGSATLSIQASTESVEKARREKIVNLTEALKLINSRRILPQLETENDLNLLRLKKDWMFAKDSDMNNLLSPGATNLMKEYFPLENLMPTIRDVLVLGIKDESQKSQTASNSFSSGLFKIGSLAMQMGGNSTWLHPLGNTASTDEVNDEGILPKEQTSVVTAGRVGDLIVVREHIWEYQRGEIGNIQNVLKSGKMLRETRRLDRTEQVDVSSESVETTEERDTATTQRFSLAQETANLIKSESSREGSLSISAKYGPAVEVKTDMSAAESQSQENSTEVASQFANDITSRAASKVVEKTFKSTTKTTVSQFEEMYSHELNNTSGGSKNISGLYQWVNKVSRSQMYNYGKRLLLDIVVPEPAAFLINTVGKSQPDIQAPTPFTESAADINEATYASLAARYYASGVKPPPAPQWNISKAFKDSTAGDALTKQHLVSIAETVTIPKNYLAFSLHLAIAIIGGVTAPPAEPPEGGGSTARSVSARVTIAGEDRGFVTVPPGEVMKLQEFFSLPMLSTNVGFSVAVDRVAIVNGSYHVACLREPEAYTKWQFETYDQILAAYVKLKTEYDRTVAENAVVNVTAVSGHNPAENELLVRNELKKACIASLTMHNFSVFGAVAEDQLGIPQTSDFSKAQKQGRYMQFLEQAFEWENVQFALYPYYWARKTTWRDRLTTSFQSPDPSFADFIRAGAARVCLPARLGFSLEVLYFLETGKPWAAGPASGLSRPENQSLAREMEAADKATGDEVALGLPTYPVVPTNLVTLREDSFLPKWDFDAEKKIWVEVKTRVSERGTAIGNVEGDGNNEEDDDDDSS